MADPIPGLILLGCSGGLTWLVHDRRIPVHWEEFWLDRPTLEPGAQATGRAFIRFMPESDWKGDWIPELKRRITMLIALNPRPNSTGYELCVAAIDIPPALLHADLSDLPVTKLKISRFVQPRHAPDAKSI